MAFLSIKSRSDSKATIVTGFNSFTLSRSQLLQLHWTRNFGYRWDICYLVEGKWDHGLGRSVSGQRGVAGNSEHGNKISISREFSIILDYLRNFWLTRKICATCSFVVVRLVS